MARLIASIFSRAFKRYPLTLAFLLLTGGMLACPSSPYTDPGPATPSSGTTVNASFTSTWSAVTDYFAQALIPIKTSDRSSGSIVAEVLWIPFKDGLRWADCGTFKGQPIVATAATFNVLVHGDSSRATVLITAHFLAGSSRDCSTRGVFEHEAEGGIKGSAEKRR